MQLKRFTIVLAIGVAALAPRVAAACGQTPTPYVTLLESLPLVRTGLPRDGAVIIRGKFWGPSGGPFQFANVRLSDEAGNPIAATSVGWFSAEPSMAYAWMTPLPPGAKITVEATVPAGPAKPVDADGPTTTTFVVEIGDTLAPPFELLGSLRVQLEAFTADVAQCTGVCGAESCTKVGERRALRARIVTPAAIGGVDFDGYRGLLHFTDDHAVTFTGPGEGQRATGNVNVMHWIDVRPGVETEVVQEIFDEAAAYAPCFSLNLWDAAGHAIQPAPVCLPSIKASEFVRILDGPNAGTAGQGGSVAAQDGGGCSTVPGRSTARWPLVMFVVAVSLCWRPPRSRAARTSPPQRAG